jgi:hypothetical protein
MRRVFLAVLVALGLMSSFLFSTANAAPPPAYTATVTEGPSCEFTLTATWKNNTRVDQVNGLWFLDGTELSDHLFTSQTPPLGTFRPRSATVHVGPLAATSETHTVIVKVQFYSRGVFLSEIGLALPVNCTRNV